MHAIHTEAYKGLTIRIYLDDLGTTESPIENDPAITMAVLHRRYVNPAEALGLTSPEAISEYAKEHSRTLVEFPLFMYDHGVTLYKASRGGANPFNCPWDSGRVGSIFVKPSELMEGADPFEAAELACAAYTAWANGDVYGFTIEDADGKELDSCWGFIEPDGPEGFVLDAARLAADCYAEEAAKDAAKKAEAVAAWGREFGMVD